VNTRPSTYLELYFSDFFPQVELRSASFGTGSLAVYVNVDLSTCSAFAYNYPLCMQWLMVINGKDFTFSHTA